jgi:predicted O-methyltransferase YrrM
MNILKNQTWRRPRLLNLLHSVGLAEPASQTIASEFAVIRKHAAGKRCAVEVGSFQGVSAAIIARELDPAGKLYCVDPWFEVNGKEDASLTIAKRHFRRNKVVDKIVLCQGVITEALGKMPNEIDFAFIDGDHTFPGLKTDWEILAPRLKLGGVICLHDTSVPPGAPELNFGSCQFFNEVISQDRSFSLVDTVYSLNVVQRIV